MKLLFVVFVLGLLCVSLLAVPSVPSDADGQQQIITAEQQWLDAEASGDRNILDNLIADDFIGNGPSGDFLTKSEIVPASGSRRGLPKSTLKDPQVRIYGDAGVLMGRMVSESGEMRATNVYVRRGGKWQMVAAHLSR